MSAIFEKAPPTPGSKYPRHKAWPTSANVGRTWAANVLNLHRNRSRVMCKHLHTNFSMCPKANATTSKQASYFGLHISSPPPPPSTRLCLISAERSKFNKCRGKGRSSQFEGPKLDERIAPRTSCQHSAKMSCMQRELGALRPYADIRIVRPSSPMMRSPTTCMETPGASTGSWLAWDRVVRLSKSHLSRADPTPEGVDSCRICRDHLDLVPTRVPANMISLPSEGLIWP